MLKTHNPIRNLTTMKLSVSSLEGIWYRAYIVLTPANS